MSQLKQLPFFGIIAEPQSYSNEAETMLALVEDLGTPVAGQGLVVITTNLPLLYLGQADKALEQIRQLQVARGAADRATVWGTRQRRFLYLSWGTRKRLETSCNELSRTSASWNT